jgi:cytochrome b pre-mRNA-processing protein 3
MILKRIFAPRPKTEETLYGAIVAAARQPRAYAEWGVPDTIDGRFDMIVLHMFLVLDRLRADGEATVKFRQSLTDLFFLDMDRSLREMGVGDLSVGKKVRKMAEAFYGRVSAYTKGMADDSALHDGLRRNIFPDQPDADVAPLANWMRSTATSLASQSSKDLVQGKVQFP